ncbi:MAG: cyanophycinase [Planctomycetaceae bacterium]
MQVGRRLMWIGIVVVAAAGLGREAAADDRLNAINPAGLSGRLLLVGDQQDLPAALAFLQRQSRQEPELVLYLSANADALRSDTSDGPGGAGEDALSNATRIAATATSQQLGSLTLPESVRDVWCVVDGSIGGVDGLGGESDVATWLRTLLADGASVVVVGGSLTLAGESAELGRRQAVNAKAAGWGLIPGLVVAARDSFATTQVENGDAMGGLPRLVLSSRAIVLVSGRQAVAIDDSPALSSLWLASSPRRPMRQQVLRRGQPIDLVAFQRAAIVRTWDELPATQPRPVEVPNGELMIVGGGGFTDEMVEHFVARAGGAKARILVIPTSDERPQLEGRGDVARFLRAGAGQVTVLHTTDRNTAATDEFLAPLREATGIWFGGGRQWRCVDAYAGTPVVAECHAVLARGGIIGGSSAGATIQGQYLVRGHPLGNSVMMAEGYEAGFGFLPGAAIDQHFTQRGRGPDLADVHRTWPGLTCIGIDETTALLVSGNEARVIGQGSVTIMPGALDLSTTADSERVVVPSGASYRFQPSR